MAETTNIAKMAEKLSDEVFGVFNWRGGKLLPTNQNWPCEDDEHNKATHPSDVVFWYDEPYAAQRTYINADLKSYAKGSIQPGNIRSALKNLALSVSCANLTNGWKGLYAHVDHDYRVMGLLFIYNHDGGFDQDFDQLLLKATQDLELEIPVDARIAVFGPGQIRALDSIVTDIQLLRGKGQLPIGEGSLSYFFPHLTRRKLVNPDASHAATIEMLSFPWVIAEYAKPSSFDRGIIVYYKGNGDSEPEFKYLFDYLLKYQLIKNSREIVVRYVGESALAKPNFSRAIDQYVEEQANNEPLRTSLRAIKFDSVPLVSRKFSEIEIGMGVDA